MSTKQQIHYRRAWLCRVSPALPSAKCRTLGKELFVECQALGEDRHSAKLPLLSARHSAKTGARQRASLPSAGHSAKDGPRQRADGGTCRHLCRVPPVRHSAKSLCRVPELGTRQSCFFLFFASKLFLQPLHIKLKYILKFGTFLDLFAIYP